GEWNPQQDFRRNGFICVNGEVNAGARIHLSKFPGLTLDVAGIGLDDRPSLAGGMTYRMCFGKRHRKSMGGEGGEEKGEQKPAEKKVDASPGLFPAQHTLGLAAHLASAAR